MTKIVAIGGQRYGWRESLIYPSEFFDVPVVGGNKLKIWTGSAWAVKPLKYWTGSAWVVKPIKMWNGTAWE